MYGATRRSYEIAKMKFSKSVRKITVWDIFEEEDGVSQPQNDSENLTPGKSEDNLHPTRDNPNHHDDRKRPNLKLLGRRRRRKRKRRRRKSTSKQQQQQWKRIQILSFNVQGYGGGQRDKKDLIRNWIKQHDRTPTIILTQETWENNDDTETDKDNGILFFSNGKKKDDGNPHVRGGVGIVLSKTAEEAWKRAGQPEPIRGQTVAKTTRNVGIELQFEDTFRKKIKLFVISTYIPCSDKKYSDEDFNETLDELQTIIERCPKGAILVIGGDFNSEIGTNNKDDNEKYEVTGIFGNTRQNNR